MNIMAEVIDTDLQALKRNCGGVASEVWRLQLLCCRSKPDDGNSRHGVGLSALRLLRLCEIRIGFARKRKLLQRVVKMLASWRSASCHQRRGRGDLLRSSRFAMRGSKSDCVYKCEQPGTAGVVNQLLE